MSTILLNPSRKLDLLNSNLVKPSEGKILGRNFSNWTPAIVSAALTGVFAGVVVGSVMVGIIARYVFHNPLHGLNMWLAIGGVAGGTLLCGTSLLFTMGATSILINNQRTIEALSLNEIEDDEKILIKVMKAFKNSAYKIEDLSESEKTALLTIQARLQELAREKLQECTREKLRSRDSEFGRHQLMKLITYSNLDISKLSAVQKANYSILVEVIEDWYGVQTWDGERYIPKKWVVNSPATSAQC